MGKRDGDGQQEDFKRALGKEGSGTGIWREEVWRIGPMASPIQPIYAGFIRVVAGCQSQNIIADVASQDTFTFQGLLRLLFFPGR